MRLRCPAPTSWVRTLVELGELPAAAAETAACFREPLQFGSLQRTPQHTAVHWHHAWRRSSPTRCHPCPPAPLPTEVVVAPAAVHIPQVLASLRKDFSVAAQNCWVKKGGAFTGELRWAGGWCGGRVSGRGPSRGTSCVACEQPCALRA